jgi:PII-like signaling protein
VGGPSGGRVDLNEDCLKLTIYFGERDRAGGGFLADALTDIYARHQLQTSLVMRGVQGFGVKHHLHSDRLLTLSEDLPLVSVAVDTRARVEKALRDVNELRFDGLVTLERARMLTGRVQPVRLPPELHEATKLTVYVGRHERVDGRPVYEAVVDLLHDRGVAGATVLLGVDGTAHGARQRARFFGANVRVPLMVIAVGDGERIARLLPELGAMLPRPLITLERIRVCKRDGQKLAEPHRLPERDTSGLGVWQKLMVYAGEQARSAARHPLHHELIRALRNARASGFTSLRGIWGYHGDQPPHGDSFWQLRRRVPIVSVIVDTPERIRRWFDLVDLITEQTGLVTSEMVPAFRATGPNLAHGGLRLAQLGDGV